MFVKAMSNDQNTQKCHQKHHFYTTIFVRLCQNDLNAKCQTPKSYVKLKFTGSPEFQILDFLQGLPQQYLAVA